MLWQRRSAKVTSNQLKIGKQVVQCFFFTRENEKCPRRYFLALFLVFFAGGKRALRGFLRYFFRFFIGLDFVFLGQKFLIFVWLFELSGGKFSIFFSGKTFFFSDWILLFFSRAQFFPLGQFSGRNLKIFLGGFFFSREKKKHWSSVGCGEKEIICL